MAELIDAADARHLAAFAAVEAEERDAIIRALRRPGPLGARVSSRTVVTPLGYAVCGGFVTPLGAALAETWLFHYPTKEERARAC